MNLQFHFRSVAEEAADKIQSMDQDGSREYDLLCQAVNAKLGRESVATIDTALDWCKARSTGDSKQLLYLNHPIRLARFYTQVVDSPQLGQVLVAALHNVFEAFKVDPQDLLTLGLNSELIEAITLLTVDRTQEQNRDYLREFHLKIEQYGDWLVLLRCLDKLDNLLGLEKLPAGETKTSYINLAEEFVAPLAKRLDAGFGDYFQAALKYAREAGIPRPAAPQTVKTPTAPPAPSKALNKSTTLEFDSEIKPAQKSVTSRSIKIPISVGKLNRFIEKMVSEAKLPRSEKANVIGGFVGRDISRLVILMFFIGPFAAFAIRNYQVLLFDDRLLFARFNWMGNLVAMDGYRYEDIQSLQAKRRFFHYSLRFTMKNGQIRKMDVNHRGRDFMQHVYLRDDLLAFVKSKIKTEVV